VRIIDEKPDHCQEALIDEVIREWGAENIFVGFSTQMTCYTPRAYEIADQFRARGVKVSLGGTHGDLFAGRGEGARDTVVKFEGG